MTTFYRILVPVDLDVGSRRALDHALRLGDPAHTEVTVLHVWEPPKLVRPDLMVYLEAGGRSLSLAEFTQNQARAALDELLSDVASTRRKAHGVLVIGSPAASIVTTAADGDYDLIVMGTRARKGLPRVMFGSVAEKVVRLASCPVLIVPIRDDDVATHGDRQTPTLQQGAATR